MRRRRAGDALRTHGCREGAERLERRVLLLAGDLDPTFGGGDGIAITDFGGTEKALDVALLPGGGILVAGTRGLMRFGPDGTLDLAFGGGDGRANLTVDATALALQGDGGILAVRSGEIVRFTADGTRDMSFGGGDGIASAPAGVGPLVDVGVLPGGRIVAVPARFLGLVAFDPSGRLDTSFGRGGSNGGGVVEADLPAPWRSHNRSGGALAVQPDGYVVVAGSVDSDISSEGIWQGLAAARFTPDGLLDPTFGLAAIDGGRVAHTAADLVIAPDGRVGVVGRSQTFPGGEDATYTVYRLLPGGGGDAAFDSDGRAAPGDLFNDRYTPHPPPSIAAAPDGKLVIAGVADVGTVNDPRFAFGVFRFNRDGTADTTFGPDHDGGVATAIGRSSLAYGVAVQPDGKVLVVGTADGNVAMARYQGDGSVDGDDQVAEAYIVPRPLSPIGARAIDTATDADLYRFEVMAGRRIGFDVDKSVGSGLNAYLRVFDAAGTQLGSNDDAAAPGESAAGGDAYVEVTFPAAGTYYVGVSSAGNVAYNAVTGGGDAAGSTTGGYSLTLADRTPRAAGDVDFSYGFDGLSPSRTGGGSQPEAGVAVLPDGGYVVGSSIFLDSGDPEDLDTYAAAVARYNPQGQVDTSFGPYEQGISSDSALFRANASAVLTAVLPGGRVVAAGNSRIDTSRDYTDPSTYLFVAGFDADGAVLFQTPYVSIGTEGGPDYPKALAVLPDGKFLVAGTADSAREWPPPPKGQDFFVIRFNADGTVDPTFAPVASDAGVALVDFAADVDDLAGLAVLPDGRLLLAGTTTTPAGTDFAVARLMPDGTLDTTFGGGDGKVTTDFGAAGGDDAANAVVLLPGGKFVLAGGATLTDRSEIALARYNADGTPDASFGGGGKVTTRLATPAAAGAAAPDGDKVVVGGRQGFGLARYNADGALDTSFGANGLAATPAGAVSQVLPLPCGAWLVNGSNGRARHRASAFPAPEPTPPGGTQVYQAEAATVSGARVARDHAGYTGTGFVDYLARAGDSVEFVANVPTAGDYVLDFRYANGGTYDRPLELAVNGQVAHATLPFAPTGAWGAWGNSTARVTLPAGRSTVRLSSAIASGPNLDAMTLRPADSQSLEAEAATLSGATVERSRPGYTGSGYADYAHAAGDFVEWKVNLPSAGRYELSFRYANGGSAGRALDLSVNGQLLPPRLPFSPTGGWSAWRPLSVTVTLAAGVNTLRLTATGGSGPNIDALTVRPAAGP